MRKGLPCLCRGMRKYGSGIVLILNFVWLIGRIRLPLRSTSRSRAVVARRAHNPKVGSSNLPFATKTEASREAFVFPTKHTKVTKKFLRGTFAAFGISFKIICEK